MSSVDNTLLHRLQAVDPAHDHPRRFSADERTRMVNAIVALSPEPLAPVAVARTRSRTWRVVAIGAAAISAIALALLAAPVLWPCHGQTAMAYGITSKPDGSVDVLLNWSQLTDVTQTQDALRAAGVPAVVIRQTSPCANSVDPNGDRNSLAVSVVIQRLSGQTGVLVRPSKIPHGDYVVFGIPPLKGSGVSVVDVFVTPTPPSCIAAPQPIPAPTS